MTPCKLEISSGVAGVAERGEGGVAPLSHT